MSSHLLGASSSSVSSSLPLRLKCAFGRACYRMNRSHLKDYSHKYLDELVQQMRTKGRLPSGTDETHKVQVQIMMRGTSDDDEDPDMEVDKAKNEDENLRGLHAKPASPGEDCPPCPICMEDATDGKWVELEECGHGLHLKCLKQLVEASSGGKGFKCPHCNKIYGKLTGTQPSTGYMTLAVPRRPLDGFQSTSKDTLELTFHFEPISCESYSARGFPKSALLPNTEEGRRLCARLQTAFERRMLFTVGTSVTTGRENVVTFNDVHLKTKWQGSHGYPDPNYLSNLSSELTAIGIDDTPSDPAPGLEYLYSRVRPISCTVSSSQSPPSRPRFNPSSKRDHSGISGSSPTASTSGYRNPNRSTVPYMRGNLFTGGAKPKNSGRKAAGASSSAVRPGNSSSSGGRDVNDRRKGFHGVKKQ